jgi:hypothetical protein
MNDLLPCEIEEEEQDLTALLSDSLSGKFYVTENGYLLCASHLAAWRAGGNDVRAEVFDSIEAAALHLFGEGYEEDVESLVCTDCDDEL